MLRDFEILEILSPDYCSPCRPATGKRRICRKFGRKDNDGLCDNVRTIIDALAQFRQHEGFAGGFLMMQRSTDPARVRTSNLRGLRGGKPEKWHLSLLPLRRQERVYRTPSTNAAAVRVPTHNSTYMAADPTWEKMIPGARQVAWEQPAQRRPVANGAKTR